MAEGIQVSISERRRELRSTPIRRGENYLRVQADGRLMRKSPLLHAQTQVAILRRCLGATWVAPVGPSTTLEFPDTMNAYGDGEAGGSAHRISFE